MSNKGLTEAIALDCEMVGAGPRGSISLPARVSVVNEYYCCIYDTYVQPTKKVTDYRTAVSGIEPHHLKAGRPLNEVKKLVASYLKGRILVGHSVMKDLKVLGLSHPKYNMRDTACYPPLRTKRGPQSLKTLAAKYAGMNIQNGAHCSVRDARATMKIYKRFEDEWEGWNETDDDESNDDESDDDESNVDYYYDDDVSDNYDDDYIYEYECDYNDYKSF